MFGVKEWTLTRSGEAAAVAASLPDARCIRIGGHLKMEDDTLLERTNRVNTLFDFYGALLTDKQQSILSLYYQDNFSLGEIAADFEVSRQAVYEHLKRAEQALEDYEGKLRLAEQFARKSQAASELEALIIRRQGEDSRRMLELLSRLLTIEVKEDTP
jgi:predicted DNA-binding protein YlxM (UPF0122 family)